MRSNGASTQRPLSAGEQRGHVGKSKPGIMRQFSEVSTSKLADGAVLGYAGHLPAAVHGFGVSGWIRDASELQA